MLVHVLCCFFRSTDLNARLCLTFQILAVSAKGTLLLCSGKCIAGLYTDSHCFSCRKRAEKRAVVKVAGWRS